MENFFSVSDVEDVQELLKKAMEVKKNPLANTTLGKHKTLGLIFYNSSLRTRISSQKAAFNLGMDVITLNIGSDGWQLESKDGAIMDQGTAEHIKEAAAVISTYVDVLGIRCFAGLEDREADYNEEVLQNFIKHATVPIVNLESSTLHPLQSLADLVTIETHKKKDRPKVVLTWAPHPRALPQAVSNSFTRPAIVFNSSIFSGEIETLRDPESFEEEEESSNFFVGEELEKDLLFFKIELLLIALYAS